MEALALPAQEEIPLSELVNLCAVDSILFSTVFFPKTVRQVSPQMHREMWNDLESAARYVSFMVFRGGAKTTLFRLYMAKRIAYCLSRTLLIVGKSQGPAIRSVEWIMRQVEFNSLWRDTFGLRKGSKWTGEEIEIYHGTEEVPIRVIAVGIGGSIRGINVDDYRPDFILVDDPCDEENTATAEQRAKTAQFFFGALQNSLAPATESPLAKMCLAQTLSHPEDLISMTLKDPMWTSRKLSAFGPDGQSRWPQRYPTETLLKEKDGFIARGKLSIWMREMECSIVSDELSAFRPQLLQFYDILPDPGALTTFMAIDPVPPPSEREEAIGFAGKDYEALAVVGLWRDARTGQRKFFLCATAASRGHDPDWTVSKFFELLAEWNPIRVKVESVAYQRTLKWLLERAMQARRTYVPIDAHVPERRKKTYRIIDTIGTALAARELYVHRSMHDFVRQLLEYPNVEYDDVIESVAVALQTAMDFAGVSPPGLHLDDDDPLDPSIPYLSYLPPMRACP